MPRDRIYRCAMAVSTAIARAERRMLSTAAAIGIAVGVYGISFGVLAVTAGMSPAQACVMSMLVFTGASQFAFVGVLAAGGGALAAMGPAVMLAVRNAAYGLSLAPILAGRLRDRALLAQLVIDESTAMARAQDDPLAARRAFVATGVSVWLCWNAGTLAGALLGGAIGDPRALGLDAMFPAAFLALLAPQLRRPGAPVAAIAGAMVAVALLPFAPAGVPVIAALAGVVPGVLVARGVRG
jgi:4-azaleucine resistance transporter AzlC